MALRYTYKTPARTYQQKALAKIFKLGGRAGVFMPMRTGKTKVSIDWAGIAFHNFGLRRVLVVCPRSVMQVWQEQISRHCAASYVVSILPGPTKHNADLIREWLEADATAPRVDFPSEGIHWVIVNYDAIWRPVTKTVRIDALLARWKPDLIIADEAHRLKWPTTNQSMAMSRLGQVAKMRIALTGTPITKWALDAFGLFRFVNSDIFGIGRSAWKDFRARYGVWGHAAYAEHAEVLLRYQNLDELVGRIRSNSFRIRLEDCFDELPERIVQDIPVRMNANAQRMYKEMAKEMITEVERGKVSVANIILTKSIRLSQLTSGFITDTEGVIHDVDDSKLNACMDLVEDMVAQDEKVSIFAHFVHDYERIFEALKKRKIKAVLHAGTEKAKVDAVQRFKTDPQTRVFVSQIATASLGLDLSAGRMLIFYSWDHRWDTYIQALERPYMPGKSHGLGVYRLVVPNSIDRLKLRVIEAKGDLADAIIHNPQNLLND